MNKKIILSIIFVVILIAVASFLTRKNSNEINNDIPINNVSIVDGKQIIEIKAKGGYTPRESTAKAGIPTILRFNTNGTFDCSSSVLIPSMNISKLLQNSGTTDIDLGNPKLGTLQGMCGMGMYPFQINFQP